jgi:hypothetical protein
MKKLPKFILTLLKTKFSSIRGFIHVSKIFQKFYLLFYVKNTIKECPVPLDISIQTENTIKQFYIVNLTKTWLGNFLGNFSLSLGNFFTKTSGYPGFIIYLLLYIGGYLPLGVDPINRVSMSLAVYVAGRSKPSSAATRR